MPVPNHNDGVGQARGVLAAAGRPAVGAIRLGVAVVHPGLIRREAGVGVDANSDRPHRRYLQLELVEVARGQVERPRGLDVGLDLAGGEGAAALALGVRVGFLQLLSARRVQVLECVCEGARERENEGERAREGEARENKRVQRERKRGSRYSKLAQAPHPYIEGAREQAGS